MYCKNCGQFLTGNENFCSNCGTKVEAQVMPNNFPSFDKANTAEENKQESIKVMSPVDDIVWDVKEFPSGEIKHTGDTEFHWRSEDMFLHKEIKREKEAFEESMAQFLSGQAAEEPSKAEDKKGLEVLDVFKDRGDDSTEQAVTRNTAPIEPVYKGDERVVEISQPVNDVAIEVTESESEGVKVEKVVEGEPKMTSVITEREGHSVEVGKMKSSASETLSPENEKAEAVEYADDTAAAKTDSTVEEKQENENEENKSSLFDEIAPGAVATLQGAHINEEKKQIDKFYTFNRKKEEFQKLLDREYERIENKLEPGGFEEDIASFMDVERGTGVEGTTQLEEMVKARTLFFDDPFFVPHDEGQTDDTAKEETEDAGIPASELDDKKSKVVFEPQNDEPLAKVLEEQEKDAEETLTDLPKSESSEVKNEADQSDVSIEQSNGMHADDSKELAGEENSAKENAAAETSIVTEKDKDADKKCSEEKDNKDIAAKIVIEPNKTAEEEEGSTERLAKEFFESDDEEEKKRMGKGSKILIWILSIIIIVTAALLVIRVALPDTFISRTMDNIADKVVGFFIDGSDSENEESRGTLQDDKTGLIQLQIDKNYKNGIGTIKYSKEAAYDSEKTYAQAALNEAKDIQKNLWYTDNDKVNHYFDEELIGAVIAFESQRNAMVNDKEQNVLAMTDSDKVKAALEKEAASNETMDFSMLEIGDIKVAGNSYFVWVIETINGKQIHKIYEFKEKDQQLLVTASYDA